MKFSTVIVSALAAVVSAAPAQTQSEKRTALDISQLNNFGFSNQNFGYLGRINALNFDVITQLAAVNNFDALAFQSLFQNQVFNINSLLQIQQLQTLMQFAQLGVLSTFDLSTLTLQTVNLGLLGPVGQVDLASFFLTGANPLISTTDITQIQTIAQSVVITKE
jgi:hypothetical protein